ncbi:hypothetical protein ACRQ5Q_08155 [Bradyrhizobium sp. PMVTL-01]|uniref:hypothetical protein n=1 Tax=Bradyrhizobium sp. PMVTL-01 TaxID=3434999 RepID=UPI003F72893B
MSFCIHGTIRSKPAFKADAILIDTDAGMSPRCADLAIAQNTIAQSDAEPPDNVSDPLGFVPAQLIGCDVDVMCRHSVEDPHFHGGAFFGRGERCCSAQRRQLAAVIPLSFELSAWPRQVLES